MSVRPRPKPTSPGKSSLNTLECSRFVSRIAKRFARRVPAHVELDDLISAGMEGVLRAKRRFDPERGKRFETFAEFHVKGAILDELRRFDLMSRCARRTKNVLERKAEELTASLGRPPTEVEVAAALGLDVSEYRTAVRDLGEAKIMREDPASSTPLVEKLVAPDPSPEDTLIAETLRGQVWAAVARLPDRQRQVVELYFRDHESLVEIAARFGVTDSRICQVKRDAIKALRAALN